VLVGFFLVATGVIWRRSVGIGAARELRVLEDLLVASLADDPGDTDLAAAIAEYKASLRRRDIIARRLRPSRVRFLRAGDPDGRPAGAGEAARTAS
jgi:hypothetical protein